MGAGFHGINGIDPTTPIHIYNVHVLPRILYVLEAITLNHTNLNQCLLKRTAIAAPYILSGVLPVETSIDRKRLTTIPPLANDPTLLELIYTQIAVKDHK